VDRNLLQNRHSLIVPVKQLNELNKTTDSKDSSRNKHEISFKGLYDQNGRRRPTTYRKVDTELRDRKGRKNRSMYEPDFS
jgi:hypothetical protein